MKYIINCATRKYAVFKGRSSRKEYIYFSIFFELLCLLVIFVDKQYKYSWMGILFILCFSFFIIPHISVNVRRFHDVNKSGWWFFISTIIPFGFFISSIALLFIKGTPGPNKYGEPPIN
jgi:uncharacterized membrane protein YhaH (DUF805 family)